MDLRERRIRVARGVAASSAATGLALAAHLVAGGGVPSPLLVAIPLVLSWLPGVALIGRAPSLRRQAAVIIPAQAALHTVFAVSGTAAHAMVEPDPMAGMGGAVPVLPVLPGPPESTAMWAGHALAAVVTVVAWQRGEQAVRTLLRLAREVVAAVLPSAWCADAPTGPFHGRPPVDALPPLRSEHHPRRPPRRGPPVGALSS